MNNISRDNHFVAQLYLDAWRNEKNQIYEYKLLVPHENCTIWSSRYIKSIASEKDFYICLNGDEESDEIEKWLNENFETPVKEALDKAIKGEKLDSRDWKKIINYMTCQIVRTPAFLQKFLNTSKSIIPEKFKSVINEVEDEFSEKNIKKTIERMKRRKYNENNNSFPIKVTDTGISDENNKLFKIETIIGKASYLDMLKHYLTKTLEVLHKHRWQIVELDDNINIPTSDDPVICLNYYGVNNYNFNGGWGRKGSEIIFPISPRRIIYTRIGYKKKIVANYELSVLIKKLIIEHAHRKIFSKFEDIDVMKQRKRVVNKEEFEKEKMIFKEFHENYKNIEKSYLRGGVIY